MLFRSFNNYFLLRILVSFAAEKGFNIHQLDVKATYLYADLKEEIYMKAPEGDPYHGNGFWKLKKALYGLKQAAREWNENITNTIQDLEFKRLVSEPCIFIKSINNEIVCIVGIYVDDVLITGTDYEINNTVNLIKEKYTITGVGNADLIIGIKIEKINNGYLLQQERYLTDILDKFGLTNCRSSKIPGPIKLINKNSNSFDATTYRAAVGSLLYLAISTRPDILYATNQASRHSQIPTLQDWENVVAIFRYLKGNPYYGLYFCGNAKLRTFIDADYGGDTRERKSTSGFVCFLSIGPTSWNTKLQESVATSTAEAEYYSLCECIKQVLWYINIIKELNINIEPSKIFIDNKSTIYNAQNETINPSSKHIDIRYHMVCDHTKKKRIELEYIKSEENIADSLTKFLNCNKTEKFRNSLLYKFK